MRVGTVPRLSLLIVALLGLPAHAPAAGTLYGSSNVADLFTIDPATGVGTPVGVLSVCGTAFTTEIEYDNRTGVAFAQARDGAFCGQQFDISNASPVGLPVPDAASYTGLETIAGIWYGTTITVGGGGAPSQLRTLDPVTGGSSLIGATGVGPIAGLAYDKATDRLYGIAGGAGPANLYTIDRDTGVATLVGSTGIQAGSLQFGPDGRLYAGGTGAVDGGDLFVIDAATASSSPVGATGFAGVTGLTLRDTDPCASLGNGGFEARNVTAWRRQDIAAPFIPMAVVGPGVSNGFGSFFSSPTDGGFALVHGFDGGGPGTIILAQDVTLPRRPVILQFDYRASWDLKNFAVSPLPRTFYVDVEPAGGGAPIQRTVILTAPSETIENDTGTRRGSVDLSAFAGQRVRVSFEWEIPEVFTGPAFFQLDNVHPLQASGLTVDAAGNGVLEPGEAVTVAPEWHNCSSLPVELLTGTATGIGGPGGPGVFYGIADGLADYGTVMVGSPRDCAAASGDCYTVEVVLTGASRPAVHWDAVLHEELGRPGVKDWILHVGNSFTDVPSSNPFYRFIETVLHNGVTAGCAPTQYCPGGTTTREQMAVFLLRARNGGGFTPPACASAPFPDVPCSSVFAPWIQELVSLGVTSGCGGGLYCPASPVTREQMAVFLLKTREGAAFTPPPCTTAPFADVPCSSPFAPWIQELAARGITAGCSATAYCPGDPVTREQMAVFLTRTFDLTLYGP